MYFEGLDANEILSLFEEVEDTIKEAKNLINFSNDEYLTPVQCEELFHYELYCFLTFSRALLLLDDYSYLENEEEAN